MQSKDIKYYKEFGNKFKGLYKAQDKQTAWADFITLVGLIIDYSHSGNQSHQDTIENLLGKYNTNELQTMLNLIDIMDAAFQHNSNQDFLGHIAYELGLISLAGGKYFSPIEVGTLASRLTFHGQGLKEALDSKGWIAVTDQTCGSGAMLIAYANECMNQDIDYENHILFIGQDISYITALTCFIQLSILRCPGYVVVGNTLSNPMTGNSLWGPSSKDQSVFYTPQFYSDTWEWRRRCNYLDNLLK